MYRERKREKPEGSGEKVGVLRWDTMIECARDHGVRAMCVH